jgi:hypothetical protein
LKEISEVTCAVIDTGLFLPMALRMAEECKRVIYFNPDQRAFPSIRQACIGDGFSHIEVAREWGEVMPNNDIDLYCVPDCRLEGFQEWMDNAGKAVWGSRKGVNLELKREHFMETLGALGLDVPEYSVARGVDELERLLKEKEDCYVKISRYRGDMETTHWREWAMDQGWLHWLRVNFGPTAEHIRFLIFDAIKTDLEIGADTYCVDGQWPNLMLNGIEGKDKCYLAAVTDRRDMPEQIQTIINSLTPLQQQFRYRNQISFEVRVKDGKAYWIDATQRAGMPSSASQHKLWENFPDIVWQGANGNLIEPIPTAKFSIECMITTKENKDCWDVVEIPEKLVPWARFSSCAYIDGRYCFPPDELHNGDLGWLVAIGDTPREVLERAKELADMLPDGLNSDVEALSSIIKEVEEMEKADIPFTDEQMPAQAEVLE